MGYSCKEIFIEKANSIHGNKYDYSKVIYKKAIEKVIIICPIHGEFEQTPNAHLSKHGCAICSNNKKSNKEEFVKKSNKIHKNKYDYSKFVYKNARTKGIVICPIHGEFEQIPDNHFRGKGCIKCSSSKTTSFPEQAIFYYLKKLNLNVENKKRMFGKEFDIYIKELNLVIEYDGLFFHKNKKEKDIQKSEILRKENIKTIRIREFGLNEIKGDINIFRKSYNNKDLENAIKTLVSVLNEKYNKSYKLDVDLKVDNIEILENIKLTKISNSIIATHPDIVKQWHPTKNGSLKPEFFSHGSNQKVWWICKNGREKLRIISHVCKSK